MRLILGRGDGRSARRRTGQVIYAPLARSRTPSVSADLPSPPSAWGASRDKQTQWRRPGRMGHRSADAPRSATASSRERSQLAGVRRQAADAGGRPSAPQHAHKGQGPLLRPTRPSSAALICTARKPLPVLPLEAPHSQSPVQSRVPPPAPSATHPPCAVVGRGAPLSPPPRAHLPAPPRCPVSPCANSSLGRTASAPSQASRPRAPPGPTSPPTPDTAPASRAPAPAPARISPALP